MSAGICSRCGRPTPDPDPESFPNTLRKSIVGEEAVDVSYEIVDSRVTTLTVHFTGGYSLKFPAEVELEWRR